MSFIDQPPMSFQQRHVGWREMLCIRRSQSMGGGTKKQKPLSMTALEAIDPKPPHLPPRG